MQKESLLIHPAPRFPLTSWETLDERLLSHEISSFILFNIKETSYWTHRNFCSRRHIVRTNYGIKHNTIRTLFLFCFSALFGDHNQLGPFFKCHGLCTLYSVFTQIEKAFRGDEKLAISTLWLCSTLTITRVDGAEYCERFLDIFTRQFQLENFSLFSEEISPL